MSSLFSKPALLPALSLSFCSAPAACSIRSEPGKGVPGQLLEVPAYPVHLVVDPDLRIRFVEVGATEEAALRIRKQTDSLLNR